MTIHVARCPICGKEFKSDVSSIYGEIKFLENLLDHIKSEHPSTKKEIEKLEEQIDRMYDIWEEEFYMP